MSSAVRKNLVDLNSALSAHQDIFRSIVIMCEQKGLITPGVSKELRDPLTGKSTQDRASQLVSNLQTAIGLQPECLDTLLCILKDEGGVSGSIVAQKIAEEYGLQKLPKYNPSVSSAVEEDVTDSDANFITTDTSIFRTNSLVNDFSSLEIESIEPNRKSSDVQIKRVATKDSTTNNTEISANLDQFRHELLTVFCESDCLHKWEEIAAGLRLPHGTISSIKNSKNSNELKLSEVLYEWKEQQTMPFTMDSIINVMEGPIVKNKAVANKLREQKDKLQHQVTNIEHTDLAVSDVSGGGIRKLSYNGEDLLGEGSYGTFVYKGWLESKREVAIKKVSRKDYSISEEEFMIECDSHPNLIRYYCKEEDDKHYYLALDLCKCSLYKYVNGEVKVSIGKLQILKNVVEGLKFLHSKEIIHRDIKPTNILLTDTKAIITDFGISRKLQGGHDSKTTTSRKGSDGWIAPEMYKDHQKLTVSVDIFSMGCLIYYVLTDGQHPFGDTSCLFNIITNKYSLAGLDALDGKIKETAKPLIEQMINYDPTQRPPVDDVFDHCLLWDKKRLQCEFKDIIGQRVQDKNDPVHHVVVAELNRRKHDVFNGDWKNYVDVELHKELTKKDQPDKQKFEYDGTLLSDLIRAIRNKITHFGELPEEVKAVFDNSNEGVVPYFTSLFPSLLIVLYETKRTLIRNGQI